MDLNFQICICNLGALPASNISVQIEFEYIDNEDHSIRTDSDMTIELRRLSGQGEHPEVKMTTLFPKEEAFVTFFIPSTLPETISQNKQTLMDVRIEYRLAKMNFKTYRTLLLKAQQKRGQQQIGHEFVPEKEYWE